MEKNPTDIFTNLQLKLALTSIMNVGNSQQDLWLSPTEISIFMTLLPLLQFTPGIWKLSVKGHMANILAFEG